MKPISLTRFLIEEQHRGHINADLRLLIEVVARACKSISTAVGKGALGGVLGEAGTGNIQGEAQKKLDVIANDSAGYTGSEIAAMIPDALYAAFGDGVLAANGGEGHGAGSQRMVWRSERQIAGQRCDRGLMALAAYNFPGVIRRRGNSRRGEDPDVVHGVDSMVLHVSARSLAMSICAGALLLTGCAIGPERHSGCDRTRPGMPLHQNSFNAYQAETTQWVQQRRVFQTADHQSETQWNSPLEWRPAGGPHRPGASAGLVIRPPA